MILSTVVAKITDVANEILICCLHVSTGAVTGL